MNHHRTVLIAGLLAACLLAGAGTSLAAHAPSGMLCTECHVFTGPSSDAWGPHRISASKMADFIAANGGSGTFAGNHVPCLFCHDDPLGTRQDMVGAKQHFDGSKGANMHYRSDTGALPTDKKALISTDASTPATTAANPLQCVNCHDAARVTYVSFDEKIHGVSTPGTQEPEDIAAGYHFMLKVPDASLGATGDAGLCDQCHAAGGSQNGVTVTKRSHALTEPDSDPLRTTNCYTCHEGHFSGTALGGTHQLKDGAATLSRTGVETETGVGYATCVSVCHNNTIYEGTGHGKATSTNGVGLDLACTNCHVNSIEHDPSNADLGLRYLLASTPGQINGTTWNCTSCHPSDISQGNSIIHHKGVFNAGGTFEIGCLVCHNEHGNETTGGIGANTFMVKTAINGSGYTAYGGSNMSGITFTGTLLSKTGQYFDNGTGATNRVCEACHPTLVSTQHTTSKNGSDCTSCHSHKKPNDLYAMTKNSINEGFVDPPTGGATFVCGDCHGVPPATGMHARHADGVDGDYTDCAACHTDNGGLGYTTADSWATPPDGTHMNGSTTLATAILGYAANGAGPADDTCTTSNCHGATTWGNSASMTCSSCHYYNATPTAAGNSADPNPLSATHGYHFNAGMGCSGTPTPCHGNLPVDTYPRTHMVGTGANDGAVLVNKAVATYTANVPGEAGVSRTTMTYDAATHRCAGAGMAAGCHATGTAGLADWDDITTADACIECHTDNSATYNPSSGLHGTAAGTMISGKPHDETLGTGCTNCHTKASITGHWNGTLSSDNTGGALGLSTAMYTDNTVGGVTTEPRGTCAGTGTILNAAGCHGLSATNDGGRWARKWSNTADDAGDVRCANCHGDYATGFVAGVVTKHTDPEAQSSHGSCYQCHSYSIPSGYYSQTVNWAYHRNGTIAINTNDGYVDNGASVGCVTSCHSGTDGVGIVGVGTSGHEFTDSPFAVAAIAGPVVTCSSCHGTADGGYWPDGLPGGGADDAGEHAAHIDALVDKLAAAGIWPAETVATLKTNNGNGTSLAKQSKLCAYCHNDVAGIGGAGHSNDATPGAEVGAFNPLWDVATGTNPPTVADNATVAAVYAKATTQTCAGIDCHYDTTTSTGWFGAGTATCAYCHGDAPATGAHAVHIVGIAPQTDRTDCALCHTGSGTLALGNTAASTVHLNGTHFGNRDVSQGYTPANGAVGSCATNVCHNSTVGDGAWNDTALNCDACHYYNTVTPASPTRAGNAAATLVKNRLDETHMEHFDAARGACTLCHGATPVAGDTTHISATVAGDADGLEITDHATIEQDEATLVNEATYLPAASWTDPDPGNATCTNDYCHDPSAEAKTAVWTTANATCTLCHGDDTTHPTTASHPAHLGYDATYVCIDCHSSNALPEHMNGTVTMKAGFTYGGALTPPYVATYGNCYGATESADDNFCHAVAATGNNPAWGAATDDCATYCHYGAAADVENTVGNDKDISRINTGAEWTTYGHGVKTTLCTGCHSTAGTAGYLHDPTATLSGANPYRLVDLDTVTGGFQYSCTYAGNSACHDGSPTAAVALVKDHTKTLMGTKSRLASWSFDPTCVSCHDPHGDATNIKMMQGKLWDRGNTGTRGGGNADAGTANSWAIPTAWDSANYLGFTNRAVGQNTTGTAFADSDTQFSGVCQECHEGVANTTTTKGYIDQTSASYNTPTTHPSYPGDPGTCTNCHKHSDSFAPSGCSGCHGGGTVGSVAASYWPDSGVKNVDGAASTDDEGAHVTHVTVIARRLYNLDITGLLNSATSDAQQKAICEYCHQAVPNDGDHGSTANLPAEVFQGTYRKHMNGATDADATFTTTAGQNSCQMTDCHNSKDTGATYGWYSGATDVCITCHTAGGAGNNPTSGVHKVPTTTGVAHDELFGPQPGNSGSTCTTCHTAMPDLTTQQVNAHINATFGPNDFSTVSNEFYVNQTTLYTDGTALTGTGAGYCSGTAAYGANCHDGVGENTATTAWKRRWTSNATLATGVECEGCHGGLNTSDWTFGVTTGRTPDGNVDHASNYGGTAGSQVVGSHQDNLANGTRCNYCHVYQGTPYLNGATNIGWNQYAANSSTYHGNGSIELNGTLGYSRTTPAFGCSSHCHGTNNGLFLMENSGWTLASLAGVSTCSAGGTSCHGGTTVGTNQRNYWPDTGAKNVDTASANEPGAHVTHITVIARRLYNLDITGLLNSATSDAQQRAICEYCHQAVTNDGDHGSTANLPAEVFQGAFRKHMNGAPDANATFTTTAGINSCQLTDCHNNKDTGTTYGWYSGATDVCITCHTKGGATNDPTSGVHKDPSTTGVAHDEAFGPQPTNSGSTCTTCHTAMPDLTTLQVNAHINATFGPNDFSTVSNEFYVNQTTLYTDGTALTGTGAGYCSGTAAYGANCHDGVGQNTAATAWKYRWTSNSSLTDGTECEGCHGGFTADDWTFGVTTGRTPDGNVDHASNYGGAASTDVIGRHAADAAGVEITKCNTCHVWEHTNYPSNGNSRIGWVSNAANSSTYHGNNSIELNSTLGYSRTIAPLFGCAGATACHGSNNSSFVLENSGWTLATLAGQSASCDSCHGYPPGYDNTATAGAAVGTLEFPSAILDSTNAEFARGVHVAHLLGDPTSVPPTAPTNVSGLTLGFVPATEGTVGCNVCHLTTHIDASPDNRAEVIFDIDNNGSADVGPSYTPATYTCNNIPCHADVNRATGGAQGPVWNDQQHTIWSPLMASPDNYCLGCHATADGTATGSQVSTLDATVADPNGSAVNPAHNEYTRWASGINVGGHGSQAGPINCVGKNDGTTPYGCHDTTVRHFGPPAGNPERLQSAAIETGGGASELNAYCNTVFCHSHDYSQPQMHHPTGMVPSALLNDETLYTTYDPAVQAYLDVDHQGSSQVPKETTLPLQWADLNHDNQTTDQVICITCHNPHGTDTTQTQEQMVRLPYTGYTADNLCHQCHSTPIHTVDTVDASKSCLNACHRFMADTTYEPGTAFLFTDARLAGLKAEDGTWVGGTNPVSCIYCHYDRTTTPMKRALYDFTSTTVDSRHPVTHEWSSRIGSVPSPTYAGNPLTPDLECVSCHDADSVGATGGSTPDYPYHLASGLGTQRLRTTVSDEGFCGYCHDNTGPTLGEQVNVLGPARSHYLSENDVPVKTALLHTACMDCHDGHYSEALPYILKVDPNGDCRSWCHSDVDFEAKGHGKATALDGSVMNFVCDTCHAPTVTHNDAGNTFRLDAGGGKVMGDDTTYCLPCHSKDTRQHTGTKNNGGAAFTAGCMRCHEPHGQNTGTNRYFVRTQVEGQTVTQATVADYYRADGNGSCDVVAANCHPDTLTVLKNTGWTGGGGTHLAKSGTDLTVGDNCLTCHQHTKNFAPSSCSSCHGDNASNNWPDSTPAATYPDTNGSHAVTNAHVVRYGGNTSCTTLCHPALVGDHTDSYNIPPGTTNPPANITLNTANTLIGSGASYVAGTKQCVNTYCHGSFTGGNAADPLWGAGAVACGSCHGNPPATGEHVAHVANAAVVYVNDCVSCHGANSNNGTHATHVNGAVNLDNTVITAFTRATATCTNSCHAAGTGEWAAAATLACIDCHVAGKSLGTGHMQTSGLHTIVPTVSGVTHDDAFSTAKTCTSCHTTLSGLVSHMDGTWQADGATQTESRGLFDDYHEAAPNSGTCYSTGAGNETGAAGCHDGSGDAGSWARLWTTTADDGGTAVCANCHGTFGDWRTGVALNQPAGVGRSLGVQSHQADWDGDTVVDEVSPYHGTCVSCHGMNSQAVHSANYPTTSMWDPTNTTGFHGNDRIDLNGPSKDINATNNFTPVAGAEYNGNDDAGLEATDFACTLACHQGVANTNHNMGDSAWTTVQYRDYGSGACSTCHGGGTSGTVAKNYWPDAAPTNTHAANNPASAHTAHLTDLAMKVYGQTVALLLNDVASDTKQKHLCKYCHNTNPGTDGDHSITYPAEVTAPFGKIWDAANPPAYNDGSAYVSVSQTCTGSDCHYNQTTYGWYSGTPVTCTSCHNRAAAGGDTGLLHDAWPDILGDSDGDHFRHYGALETLAIADINNCTACHSTTTPADATMATMATHLDGDRFGDVTIATAAGKYDDKSAGTPAYTPAANPDENNGTCANVSCHGGVLTPAWRDGDIDITAVAQYNTGCPTCHIREDASVVPSGTEYNSARSGGHVDHDHGCATCHNALPPNHYVGIDTIGLDSPNPNVTIGSVLFSVEYTDATTTLNATTQGFFTNAATSGSCATVDCHFGQTAQWDYTVATCGTCHLASPTTNAHAVHYIVGTTGAEPDHTDCDLCHPSSTYQVQATGNHVTFLSGTHASTGTITYDFVAGIGKTGTGATTTCTSATMCHKSAAADGQWNDTALNCDSCHYYNTVTPASPTRAGNTAEALVKNRLDETHMEHFDAARGACTLCHGATPVAGDTTHISATVAGDADGLEITDHATIEQDEATLVNEATYLPAASWTDPDPGNATCTNDYCHDPSAEAKTAVWTTANAACTLCHGDDTTHPTTASHPAHLGYDATYVCIDCHSSNALPEHMNGTVTMKAGFTYGGALTPPYVATYGNCYGATESADDNFCHAVAATGNNPAWGAATDDCATYCHYGAAADVENTVGNDKDISRINTGAEWTTYGHGVKTTLCTGCHSTAGTAGYLHDPTATLSGANPYRLVDLDTVTGGFQYSCTYAGNSACHDGSPTAAVALVKDHTKTLMGTKSRLASWSFDPTCVSCHDPHGDATNIKMMQGKLWDRGNTGTRGGGNADAGTANSWAIPTAWDSANYLGFTNRAVGQNTTGTAFADSDTQFSGVCQECHEGVANTTTTKGYIDQTSASYNTPTTHPVYPADPGTCTGCHKHSDSFAPSGCSGCHGGATTGVTAKSYWPDSGVKNVDGAASTDDEGAHLTHVTVIARRLHNMTITQLLDAVDSDTRQKQVCEYCHQAVPNDGDHGSTANLPAEVFQGAFRKHMNGAADNNATFTTTAGINSCQLTDCHNNKDTGTTYGWYSGATDVCITCHTKGGATNDPTSGVHKDPSTTAVAHDEAFGPQPTNSGSTCTTCHTAMPDLTTLQVNAHINATFGPNDFSTVSNEFYVNQTTLYTDGTALTGTGAGYCSGTAAYGANCHDGVGQNTAATAWKYRWTSNSSLTDGTECEGCHGGFTADDWTFGVTTGRTPDGNVDHASNYGGAASTDVIGRHAADAAGVEITKCNTCHVWEHTNYPSNGNSRIGWVSNAANSSTYHGNNSIELNSTLGYSRTIAPLFGCAGATACHGSNNSSFVLENSGWTLATLAGQSASCDSCHGYPPGYDNTATAGAAVGTLEFPSAILDSTNAEFARGVHVAHLLGDPTSVPPTAPTNVSGLTLGFVPATEGTVGCNVCHLTTHIDASPDNRAEVIFDIDNNGSADVGPSYTPATYTCNNIPCHADVNRATGGAQGPVWNDQQHTIWSPLMASPDNYCLGCHATADGTATGSQVSTLDATVADPNGSAVNPAHNEYTRWASGINVGGHGSQAGPINCVGKNDGTTPYGCHDTTVRHFGPPAGNPERLQSAAIETGGGASELNAYCNTVFCHSHDYSQPQMHHPTGMVPSALLNDETLYTTYDPAVQAYLDVDHQGSSQVPKETTLPLQWADLNHDNQTTDQVICITCHNPHGTDTTQTQEQMVRLPYTGYTADNLCHQCHSTPIHTVDTVDASKSCLNACHRFMADTTYEPGTAFLFTDARLAGLKAEDGTWVGGTNPVSCIYCHYDRTTTPMKRALYDFTSTTVDSRHPVTHEWSSRIGSVPSPTYAGNPLTPDLECVSCHDADSVGATGGSTPDYPYHLASGLGTQRLRTTVSDEGFCGYCHDNTGPTLGEQVNVLGPARSHYLSENDVPVKTALLHTACMDCHDGHYSEALPYILKVDPNGDCRSWCHSDVDFEAKGHGKATALDGSVMNFVCDTCHAPTVTHNDAGNTFRLDAGGGKVMGDDTTYCLPCHSKDTRQHTGTKNNGGAAFTAGCMRCHEPHGQNTGTNRYFVRTQVEGQTVTQATVADYYRADGNGSCDVVAANCHPDTLTVLKNTGWTGGGGTHLAKSGTDLTVGDNCLTCHQHTKNFAPSSCSSCHGDNASNNWPDSTPAATYPDTNGSHAVTNAHVVRYGGNTSCTTLCHPALVGDHTGGYPGSLTPPADITLNTANTLIGSGASYVAGTKQCVNTYCHGSFTGGNAADPLWGAGAVACGSCHGNPPATNQHASHMNAPPAGAMTCATCHGAGSATGTHANHVNGTVNVTLATGTWTKPNCISVPCHIDSNPANGATLDSPSWTVNFGAGSAKCLVCHSTTNKASTATAYNSIFGGNPAANVALMWAGDGVIQGGHGDAAADNRGIGGGGTLPILCTACHENTANHFPPSAGNPKRLLAAAIDNGTKSTLPAASVADRHELNSFCITCHGYIAVGGTSGTVSHHSSDYKCVDFTCATYQWVEMSRTGEYLYTAPTTGIGPGYNPTGIVHRDDDGSSTYTYSDTLPLADDNANGTNNYPSDVVICITCHDPHGAKTAKSTGRNHMLRVNSATGDHTAPLLGTLCEGCHRL